MCLFPKPSAKHQEVKFPKKQHVLVGGFNPFEKYESKWESSPNRGEKSKNIWNHHLVHVICKCNLNREAEVEMDPWNQYHDHGTPPTGPMIAEDRVIWSHVVCKNIQQPSLKVREVSPF